MSSCTSPNFRIPIESSNFQLLNRYDKARERYGGVMFFGPRFQDEYSHIPGWNSDDIQILRCGQCTACRLFSSYEWAVRCSLEASMHEYNYFITLTYDDFHLPVSPFGNLFIDYEGNIFDSNLRRRDIQLFLKQLREYERVNNGVTGIKVFYCGEYGSLFGRPHFHLCLFGSSPISDLTLHRVEGNFKFYKSVTYESFWSEPIDGKSSLAIPRGFVDISELSFDTLAYTARYVLKKRGGLMKKEFLSYYNELDEATRPELRMQPFVGYSLRPGIAAEYYEKNKLQIREEDSVKYQKKFKLYTSKPPRYFDKLFDREDPEGFTLVKERRIQSGLASRNTRDLLFSESSEERLLREEKILQEKEARRVRRL